MPTEIGDFLRSRRARITPGQAGLAPGTGRRRVPGLRREELALLAGVSADYYVHLEQGRTAHVSDRVLDAIAGALGLSGTEREHLGNLARPRRRGPRAPRQQVSSHARALLDLMDDVPALVMGRRMDVLASNQGADAVFGAAAMAGPGAARAVFLDPQARVDYLNWDDVAADIAGHLKLEAGRHPDDPLLASLVGELCIASPEFRRLWDHGDVRQKTTGRTHLAHPLVGELTFSYEVMQIAGRPDQFVITYAYARGTPTAERVQLLLSWNAQTRSVPSVRTGQT